MQQESSEEENCNFLLDLQLPLARNPRKSNLRLPPKNPGLQILEYSETHEKGSIFSKVQSRGVGFRFIAILEEAFGCNLRDDNPWMNAESKQKTFKMKRVRFTPLEVFDKTLPNCQISGENKSPGCLHAVSCPNNAFETFDVIGQHAWQNRQMLLKFISDKEEPSI